MSMPILPNGILRSRPQFCHLDGNLLLERKKIVFKGYGVYNGKKLPDEEEIILYCSLNPSHPTWLRYETVEFGNEYWIYQQKNS